MNSKLVVRFLLGIVLAFVFGFWQSAYGWEPSHGFGSVGSQSLVQSLGSPINHERELALQHYSSGRYTEAITIWERLLRANPANLSPRELAELHSNLGAAYRQSGLISNAIRHWQQAISNYQLLSGADTAILQARVSVDLASAYNANGQSKLSPPILLEVIDIARKSNDRKLVAVAFGVLGNVWSETGQLDKAVDALQTSARIATELEDIPTKVIALNNLGKVLTKRAKQYSQVAKNADNEGDLEQSAEYKKRSTQDINSAIATFREAADLTKSMGGILQVNSTISLLKALQNNPQQMGSIGDVSLSNVFPLLDRVSDSRSKAYALINSTFIDDNTERKIQSLEQAAVVAKNTGDLATESYALGILGHTYELKGQYSTALNKTRSAILVSQQVNAQESLYRWQWQAGRILQYLGNHQEAIANYKQAVATLQAIRGDIVAESVDLQFDVRDEVEPIYRELIDLLLSKKPTQAGVQDALVTLDLLKLTELQDYFGDDCVQLRPVANKAKDVLPSTVVISSIILANKGYIVLRLPNGELKSYPIALASQELESLILQFRGVLEDVATNDYFALSQKLYDLLIRPIESDLAAVAPKNLIFVNDGLLRNIPMAALYDGKQFLVEKFGIASSIGFDLFSDKPSQRERQALIFGLTVKIPPFPALSGVAIEAQSVHKLAGGRVFLNADFTLANLLDQIQNKGYRFVHLATHGKFGATADTTFLQAFDTRVNLPQFEKILSDLKHPIELLTLSACQTAAGDNRSTLGLAGVAVRNNVKNVLATLWFVNDADAVSLIEDFYTYLKQPDASPVAALRKAQITRIKKGDHPALWSDFILLGNSF